MRYTQNYLEVTDEFYRKLSDNELLYVFRCTDDERTLFLIKMRAEGRPGFKEA